LARELLKGQVLASRSSRSVSPPNPGLFESG
jgi:hypothetical protein